MKSLISQNGELLEDRSARLDVLSPAFKESKAVYTSVRTYNSRAFRLEQHLQRLKDSAEALGFPLKHSIEHIRTWVLEIIAASPFSPHFLRITATPEDTFVESRPLEVDPQLYQGVPVISVPMTREMLKAKVVGTPGTNRAYQQAQEQGAYEALLLNPKTNCLTEGSRSNILWVQCGVLYWCDEALSGITQACVLELAEQIQLPIAEGMLEYDALEDIEELFLTQTSKGLLPILAVDDQQIGSGKPGVFFTRLSLAFNHLTAS